MEEQSKKKELKEVFYTLNIFDADRAVAALTSNKIECERSNSDSPLCLKIGYGFNCSPIRVFVSEEMCEKAIDILTQIGLMKQ